MATHMRYAQATPTAVSGQRSVVSGQRSAVSGQWSVVSGQWSAVSGQPLAVGHATGTAYFIQKDCA
ncbi:MULTISPECIES: hypothetical protein [Moorena]|uniref:Uncharacterized protein n=1 Tax=Moorena bouillonii PNG TaxID=568701 RepID=A0A1U7N6S3_9CYAN|nr:MULTISPECIES: hypothetical protein [Moorena]OLT61642.1 hypothetical protein BJP37_24090 [Moorena bouillonii PNG]